MFGVLENGERLNGAGDIMAYVPLTTVADGDTILTAWGNQVKDNFAAGVPDIFTTKGDIAVASGADTASRLAAGADFRVLHAMSSATLGLEYTRGVWSRATKLTAQSIATATDTKVQIESGGGDDDLYSMYDGVNYRLTIPATLPSSRYYIVSGICMFAAHATDATLRQLTIKKNGSSIAVQSTAQVADDAISMWVSVTSAPLTLDVASYVELYAQQNSGGNLNISNVLFGLSMIR